MMEKKRLVVSIIQFLNSEILTGAVSEDSAESLEVAVQCLETTYDVHPDDVKLLPQATLEKIFNDNVPPLSTMPIAMHTEVTAEDKAEAEKLKNEGNLFMKADNFNKAIECYDRAISLDPENPVYYCNRAAAKSKLEDHQSALCDCEFAIKLDPNYSKAYGRMGLANSNLRRYKEAKECYETALRLEPDNEAYKSNLAVAKEKLGDTSTSEATPNPPVDLRSLDNDSMLMYMAQQIMNDSGMMRMFDNFISGNAQSSAGANENSNTGMDSRFDAIFQAGQRLAQQIQASHPELVESLRQIRTPNETSQDNNADDKTNTDK